MTAEAKTEAERTPPETGLDEVGRVVAPPQRPRQKMNLEQQADFLFDILERCKMLDPDLRGRFAGEAILTLTTDDMLRLETVQQTLAIFHQQGAADLVKAAMWRKRSGGSRQ